MQVTESVMASTKKFLQFCTTSISLPLRSIGEWVLNKSYKRKEKSGQKLGYSSVVYILNSNCSATYSSSIIIRVSLVLILFPMDCSLGEGRRFCSHYGEGAITSWPSIGEGDCSRPGEAQEQPCFNFSSSQLQFLWYGLRSIFVLCTDMLTSTTQRSIVWAAPMVITCGLYHFRSFLHGLPMTQWAKMPPKWGKVWVGVYLNAIQLFVSFMFAFTGLWRA